MNNFYKIGFFVLLVGLLTNSYYTYSVVDKLNNGFEILGEERFLSLKPDGIEIKGKKGFVSLKPELIKYEGSCDNHGIRTSFFHLDAKKIHMGFDNVLEQSVNVKSSSFTLTPSSNTVLIQTLNKKSEGENDHDESFLFKIDRNSITKEYYKGRWFPSFKPGWMGLRRQERDSLMITSNQENFTEGIYDNQTIIRDGVKGRELFNHNKFGYSKYRTDAAKDSYWKSNFYWCYIDTLGMGEKKERLEFESKIKFKK